MSFKLWSQSNKEAEAELKPDFGFRAWTALSPEEKYKIWQYLKDYFFDKDVAKDFNSRRADQRGYFYQFYGEYDAIAAKEKRIYLSILALNHSYKAKSYGKNFLEDDSVNSACKDFYLIFSNESENVVLELLSFYSRALISERKDETLYKTDSEPKEKFEKRQEDWRWQEFDKFTENLNEVFTDFGLNTQITRLGFIPRQEKKIMEEIYEPVLKYLSHTKWKKVNQILSDAFLDYRKNTDKGYSNCVTNTVAAVEAFLQISVGVGIGSEKLSKLIPKARTNKVIPDDFFTETLFKNIESIFARERQETGNAHPKKEYATEKNARMILNLAMIFMQHCI